MKKENLKNLLLKCEEYTNNKQYKNLYELIQAQERELRIKLQEIYIVSFNFKNLIHDSSKIKLILDILEIIE